MTPDTPLTGDFAIVSEIVRQQEKDFAALGFELNEVTWEGSEKLGRYPVFKFLNKKTDMEIHILFSPAREGRNGGFVATIVKPVNHVLNVKDYLKLHGAEDPTRQFRYREPTDLQVFAQFFFTCLADCSAGNWRQFCAAKPGKILRLTGWDTNKLR